MKLIIQFIFLFSFAFSACKDRNSKSDIPVIVKLPPISATNVVNKQPATSASSYDVNKPDRHWKLPEGLVEVSGNSWVDNEHLILIEDQHPTLYLIKIGEKATLEKTIDFQKNEKNKFDIEDVVVIDNVAFALWSRGTLFEIKNWNSKPDVEEIKTFLGKDNNTEGLCYDPVTKSLLVACKGESGLNDEKKSAKAVYQFDMESKTLQEKPFLVIHEEDFEKLAGDKIKFNPSAIAIHPETKDMYLLSTQDNKCLAVFNREGKLISFQFIDKDLMPQPEGICFSPDGKMYISSEGKKGEAGNLFEFNPKK
jgi:uncharacterized protein YjiK